MRTNYEPPPTAEQMNDASTNRKFAEKKAQAKSQKDAKAAQKALEVLGDVDQADLEQMSAAAQEAETAEAAARPSVFPCAMYFPRITSDRYPNGYEARRVENPAQFDALGPGWVDSPTKLPPSFPT